MKFAQPAWLILLVLLPLLGAAAIAVARLRGKQWNAFVAPRLRSFILKRTSPLPRWFALLFLLAACASVITALARPQGDAGTRTEKSLGRNLLIALDLSRSMRVSDVKPDRLAQAKMVIYEMLETMPNERIGLIGFAGSAYIYAPLTVDHSAVRETVDQIDESWTTQGGSNLGAAISLAIETFSKTGQKNNALVILSDGEKHDRNTEDLIDKAAQAGIYIVAIGVGTEDGDFVPHPSFPGGRMLDDTGKPVISRLQADVLRELASETKGRFTVAGTGADVPAMVKSVLKDLDAFEMEGRERRISIEFYQWLLLPAIVFLMGALLAGTRWRGVNPALASAAVFLIPMPSSRADAVSDAKQALRENRHADARDAYRELAERSKIPNRTARFRLGEASAAYQNGDFRDARSAYSKALLTGDPAVLESAHLGLGVTLFQLGWLTLAGQPYPADAADAPDLNAFDELVRSRFEELLANEASEAAAASKPIETLVTNWTDAVRHFDTVLSSGHSGTSSRTKNSARNNREVTITYLKRLQELLDEEIEQTEEAIPDPQPGEGEQGQPGEGEPQDPQEGDSDEQAPGEPRDDQQGEGEDQEPREPNDGDENEQESNSDEGKNPSDEESEGDADGKAQDPNESPEDRARRLLKENADLEKGPLSPGRREFRDPAKDW